MSAKNGKPCVKCGANEWTNSGDCKPCAKERDRCWREKNREKSKETSRQWREKNLEKTRETSRRWAKENPERHAEKSRRWAENNREKTVEMSRRWREHNPDKAAASGRRWRENNRERVLAKVKQWAINNKEKVNESNRRWAKNNPEKVTDRRRRWQRSNPDKVAVHQHRRRVARANAAGSFTAAEWKALVEHYDHKCLCCGRSDIPMHVDHVIPLSKGGSNNIDNLQPLCKSCNSRKRDKTIDYRPNKGMGRWVQKKLFG